MIFFSESRKPKKIHTMQGHTVAKLPNGRGCGTLFRYLKKKCSEIFLGPVWFGGVKI
jgi:hypothetical protein